MSDAGRRGNGGSPPLKLVHPDQPTDDVRPILRDRLTDVGNAERLVALHGLNIRHVPHFGRWLIWDGTRWCTDNTGEIERLAKETVQQIYREAASTQSGPEREAVADHAKRSEALSRIRAMMTLAKSEPGIPLIPEQLDADPWLLNVKNGTLDLRTGELQPHRREDLITKLAPVEYDPSAACPKFKSFLAHIMAGNDGLTHFLQKAIGYAMTGDTSEQVMFIFHGTGANGKSTLLNVVLDLLGNYAQQTPADALMIKRDSGASNHVARLQGARFVSAVEVESHRPLAEVFVKQVTGGDRIAARFLYREFFEFRPQFKLFLATNHLPEIRGSDEGIWRRIHLIPFEVIVPEAKRDKALPQKLREEFPGILSWMVKGCLAWQREGLSPPQKVIRATSAYRAEMDWLAGFIDDECVLGMHMEAQASNLYEAFNIWSVVHGGAIMSQKEFGRRLRERGFERKKRSGVIWWKGLRLRKTDDPGRDHGDHEDHSRGSSN